MDNEDGLKEHPLLGAVICCTAINPDIRDHIHSIATLLGAAKCCFDLTMEVTHLVIGNTTSAKYQFVAKNSPYVHVILPDFFEAMRLKYLAAEEIDLEQFHMQNQAPVFYKLRISITGYTDIARRENLANLIRQNGAEYCPDLDRSVTHLIAKEASGRKYNGAAARRIITVSEEWLTDSIRRGMVVDEALYDIRMLPEERGIGAWIQAVERPKFASVNKTVNKTEAYHGKMGRDTRESTFFDASQFSRKFRRSIRTKLVDAHDAIWADIKPKSPESIPQNVNTRAEFSVPFDIAQEQRQQQQSGTSKGLFTGLTFYLIGFANSKKSLQLDQYITSHGGQVRMPDQITISTHEEFEWSNILLISPHNVSEKTLLPLPLSLQKATRVTEYWVEASLFRNRRLDPAEHPLCRPFFTKAIPGFEHLIISSTGFTDEEPALLVDVIKLLGASYDEFLKPSCSFLLSRTSLPSSTKVNFAKEHSIPIVKIDWLWNCIKSCQMMPYEGYLIDEDITGSKSNRNADFGLKAISKSAIFTTCAENPCSEIKHPIFDLESETLGHDLYNRDVFREVSLEKLNSPQRSPQRVPAPGEICKSSPKSVHILSEILTARRATKTPSLPNSAEAKGLIRRKRTLGRATSLGLHTINDKEDANEAGQESMEIPELMQGSQVTYGNAADEAKRIKLLSDLARGASRGPAQEKVDAVGKRKKTPTRNKANRRRRH